MIKCLVNAILVCFVVLLSSCQSTSPSVTQMFSFAPSEASLSQSVQDALYRSNDPIIGQVHVETVQGRVILSGYVKKIRQSDTAEQLAREVSGVQSVENRIIVRQ